MKCATLSFALTILTITAGSTPNVFACEVALRQPGSLKTSSSWSPSQRVTP